MRKLFISLCFSACCSLLAAQTTNPIQEAMANYDYETALMLIDQETPTVPLLYQKGKALKGLYNPQNEMFRLLGTKRSFSQNETFFFSHPYPPTLPFST